MNRNWLQDLSIVANPSRQTEDPLKISLRRFSACLTATLIDSKYLIKAVLSVEISDYGADNIRVALVIVIFCVSANGKFRAAWTDETAPNKGMVIL